MYLFIHFLCTLTHTRARERCCAVACCGPGLTLNPEVLQPFRQCRRTQSLNPKKASLKTHPTNPAAHYSQPANPFTDGFRHP